MKLLLSGFDDSLKWGDALYVNSNAFPEAVAVISSDGSRKLYRSDGTVAEAKNGAPISTYGKNLSVLDASKQIVVKMPKQFAEKK